MTSLFRCFYSAAIETRTSFYVENETGFKLTPYLSALPNTESNPGRQEFSDLSLFRRPKKDAQISVEAISISGNVL